MGHENIENVGKQIETIHEDENTHIRNIEALNQAISKVSMDAVMISILSHTLEKEHEAKKELDQKKQGLKERLKGVVDDLSIQFKETEQEVKVLNHLSQSGIDIDQEAYAILNQRRVTIHQTFQRIENISNQFGLNIEINKEIQNNYFQLLQAYMGEHNYGLGDYPEYSQDPEWQRLHTQAFPEAHQESSGKTLSREEAFRQLSDYMKRHNWGLHDYPEYSKDPEWERLHSQAFPEYHHQEEENRDLEIRGNYAEGEFCSYKATQINDHNWFIQGKNHEAYLHYYENYGELYETKELPKNEKYVEDVDLGLVEGIHVSSDDMNSTERFWADGRDKTMVTFMEIASHIPEVKSALKEGRSIDSLLEDPVLCSCTSLYFLPHRGNAPRLYKGEGFYEWSGNGRHRILAARALGYTFPMVIDGTIERRKK